MIDSGCLLSNLYQWPFTETFLHERRPWQRIETESTDNVTPIGENNPAVCHTEFKLARNRFCFELTESLEEWVTEVLQEVFLHLSLAQHFTTREILFDR